MLAGKHLFGSCLEAVAASQMAHRQLVGMPVPSLKGIGETLAGSLSLKNRRTWLRSVAAIFQALQVKWMLWESWTLLKW